MASFTGRGEAALKALLLAWFVGRTSGRGPVLPAWALQAEVLWHVATGAFVTHGGRNSALQAITAGVPMVWWPMYTEQWRSKMFVTEGMMQGYDEGVVTTREVEDKNRRVGERWIIDFLNSIKSWTIG